MGIRNLINFYFLRLFVAVDKINQNEIAYTFFIGSLKTTKKYLRLMFIDQMGHLIRAYFEHLKDKKITKNMVLRDVHLEGIGIM